ncbi:uncharacterized protein LOC142571175 isoform X1 [Dermacentor variabilis]|uniref:uncharacterized protein LOC142571175 isoform X1 n=1 Tax=Dermacentor variabilis TaxID=34621 RepID=UPI003F5C0327
MNALVLFHLLCVLAASADASKFEPCGKRPGLITSSKGAAVAAKFIEKCGKDIALGYPWNTTTLQKVLVKSCLGVQLCYSHHRSFRQGTFSLTDEQMTSLTEQFQVCLLPDVLPKDARILLAMLRYLQKSLVFGST